MARPKGAKGKKTLERERARQLAAERAAALQKAAELEDLAAASKATGKKLAKDVMRDLMELFLGMAAWVQPWPASRGKNPNENRADFLLFSEKAADLSKALAPFESPRYSAVMVGATVVTRIEVVGGMPNDFAMPAIAAPIAPGTVITAEDPAEPALPPPKASAA